MTAPAYRTILVELRDDGPATEARVRAAAGLARRFGGELVAIHVAPLALPPVGFGATSAYVDAQVVAAQREANRVVRDHVRQAFERLREAEGVPARGLFLDEAAAAGGALSDAARAADLAVLGQARHAGLEALTAQPVDEVLVQAGGPVLVLPEADGPADGTATATAALPPERAVVAWNGSRQAARAVKDALPLLVPAAEVTVLALGEPGGPGPEDAAAMLARHGVKARPERRPEAAGDGGTLLEAAAGLGADLLVMGAYSHSRLRQALFGGATREVLDAARLPVLFGH